jgi:hypothetical protein
MALSQRDAVHQAVTAILGNVTKVDWDAISKDKKALIFELLVRGFTTGEIELKGNRSVEWITKYVPGLVNNWCRKDKRLNGDTEYVPKTTRGPNPVGGGDETMQAMRGLLGVTTDPDARKLIELEIAKRAEELKPKVTIDLDKLPEHLRALMPKVVAPNVIIRKKEVEPAATTDSAS